MQIPARLLTQTVIHRRVVSRRSLPALIAFALLAALGSLMALPTWADPACAACAVAPEPTAATSNKEPAQVEKELPMVWGVVISVLPEKGGLLIKHEEIPGVMKAMTMLFKVDEATLKAAKKNQVVKGRLLRQENEWWLKDTKLAD